MKVAIINNAWRGTSIGRYVYELLTCFKEMKKDVEVVYLESRRPFGLDDKKIKVLKAPINFPIFRAVLNNYFYFPYVLPKGYDVYHMSNQTIAKCCDKVKPNVILVADVFAFTAKESYNSFTNFLLKKHLENLRHAEKVIAISEYTKNDIVRLLKIPEEKIEVLLLGVNTKFFKPRNKMKMRKQLGVEPDKKIIFHVGREEPRKNIPTLIKAFYKIHKKFPDSMLIRIGDITPQIQKLIKTLGLDESVKYIDVDTKIIHLYYNIADLFMYPSKYEGFGLPCLESMASGVPVIASNVTSVPEILKNAGITLKPNDVDGFAKNAIRVLSDDDLAKEMVKKGLKRSKELSWKQNARRTWEIYEEVSGRNT